MTGGLLVLAAYGAQDKYITGNPQITFFVAVYRRYTNFSVIQMPQLFTGDFDFGKKIYCQLERIGDLVNQMFLKIKLPSLEQYSYSDINDNQIDYYWVNSIGHSIIKIIEVEIGGNVIDRQYGVWMEIWSELTVPLNKRDGYFEMIGKSMNPINLNNNKELLLYVPLQFWFCKNIGLSLPLIALQDHEVRINLSLRNYNELIISSNGSTIIDSPNKQQLNIISGNLEVDYIFLEEDERKIFVKNNLQYLITQIQVYPKSLDTTNYDNVIVDFNFNHMVSELIWVIQNGNVLSSYSYGGNEWFNFSTQPYKNGDVNGLDPMIDGKFLIEGNELTETKDSKYYKIIVPYQRHTNVPNNFIYVYSFSLNPEEYQPSGTCNFSRIDSAILQMRLSEELVKPIIQLFAVNYNILNIANGMAGVEYSN
tara:strand:+ start:1126 stop:2391 length:1266 start_codon:yes stop_codon:yes gene_type:complete